MTTTILYGLLGTAAVAALLLLSTIRVYDSHECAVVSRLGRPVGTKGPGLFCVVPIVDRLVKVSLKTTALTIPHQEVVTKDSITLRVDEVAYILVADPVRAVLGVDDYKFATYQAAQTAPPRQAPAQRRRDERPALMHVLNRPHSGLPYSITLGPYGFSWFHLAGR